MKAAAIKGLYERAYGPMMDRVWVVSATEQRAMRLVSGCRHVDVIPNGVDIDTFRAVPAESLPKSVVFWGRLGFGPNLQGLRWFVQKVWPVVREREPNGQCLILGSDPPAEVAALHGQQGLRVIPNLPDLRPEISRSAVAILPFVSGGGIKNKLLEAAAMGRAIVGTPRAMSGLRSQVPAIVARSPKDFADGILRLWAEPATAAELGADARRWAVETHSWRAAALEAVAGINDARANRPSRGR
jgi:glycosyltransferase involved in cell wall biosynthesis